MKVLIIEQEKTLQQSLSYFVGRFHNCEVFLVGSGREGISLLESTPIDVVLCGDRLPDGDGLGVLKELMKQNPRLISILMTVHGDEVLKQQAMAAGIRGYLEKPFNLKELEEIIILSNPLSDKGEEEGFHERR